jgi:hypothetical protein
MGVTSRQLHELEKAQSEKRLRSWGDPETEAEASTTPRTKKEPPAPPQLTPASIKTAPQHTPTVSKDSELRGFLGRMYEAQVSRKKLPHATVTIAIPFDLAEDLRELSQEHGIPLKLIYADALTQWLEVFKQLLSESK